MTLPVRMQGFTIVGQSEALSMTVAPYRFDLFLFSLILLLPKNIRNSQAWMEEFVGSVSFFFNSFVT